MKMSANLQRRLTVDQRLLLAECVRSALVGWMITCPRSSQIARRIQYQATTAAGFSFSRFAHHAIRALGPHHQPVCPGTLRPFPLSLSEAVALSNDIEMELATDDELYAAGLICAHGAFAQPEVCSPSWKIYVAAMRVLGIAFLDGNPDWKQRVRDRLRPFRRAVASAVVAAE
jgi:hypothetical protein